VAASEERQGRSAGLVGRERHRLEASHDNNNGRKARGTSNERRMEGVMVHVIAA
jgi:hypothetical protein